MSEEVNLDIVESFIAECNIEGDSEISLKTNGLTKNAIEALLKMYYEEKAKNEEIEHKLQELETELQQEKAIRKNRDLILRNIREEFLKYNWETSNPIQVYNQLKSLYERIFCKILIDDNELLCKKMRRKEYAKKYYEKHKEERKAYQKKYAKEHYEEHYSKILEANKKYRQKHPEKFAESKKKWYDKNKERILKQQKEYRASKKG